MMKYFKSLGIIAGFLLLSAGSAFAFHGGGVAHCDGCHSMHNSTDNLRSGDASSASLMKGSDASSTCLNCHNGAARYHVSSANGSNTNEGGDFHWVKDNGYTFVEHGNTITVDYNNKGHNVIAADYSMAADPNVERAPGGSYLAANLGCSSCHDPHGQAQGGTSGGAPPISVSGSYGEAPATGTIAGNYRLLFDSAQTRFVEYAPIARASGYDGASVQYGSGMNGWCYNCHMNFYTTSYSRMHPVDRSVPATYNSYVATGNFTGTYATGYDPLVPLERGVTTGSWDLPDPTDSVTAGEGANGTEKIMCLTCHRAHASAFDNALRWDHTSELLAESWVYLQSNVDLTVAAPYYKHGVIIDVADPGNGSPFTDGYGPYQRSLCNKCHVQD